MEKYDVIVAGGGLTGVAAAVAAARQGARVMIIEKANCLGGAATNCLVSPFVPFYTEVDGERMKINRGIFEEIHNMLAERNAVKNLIFSEEQLKLVLNRLVTGEKIDLLFHSFVFEVERDGSTVRSVTVANKNGKMTIEADYFIDATGDADVTALAGCPFILGRDEDNLCQPMTLCFRVGNVDVPKFRSTFDKLNELYQKHLKEGRFINPRENILVFSTMQDNVLHFNTTRVVKRNPVDTLDVTAAEIEAREQVFEVYDFLKRYADGFENSFLMMTAPEIGVRESRRIIGEYMLTFEDIKSLTPFEDSVAVCNYFVDVHSPDGTGTFFYHFPKGTYYTIPYRCLIPRGVDNLLVAGRCISTDHITQGSYRCMPIVCNIGEAAGTAIGLAVKSKKNTKNIDVKELQKVLISNNAFIGL